MQGREDAQRGYLDVEALAGELLAPGSVFAFLAKNRGRLFPDSMMEDPFPSGRGRPLVPAPVIGSVLVLQALQGFSDRETAEALPRSAVSAVTFPAVRSFSRRTVLGMTTPEGANRTSPGMTRTPKTG